MSFIRNFLNPFLFIIATAICFLTASCTFSHGQKTITNSQRRIRTYCEEDIYRIGPEDILEISVWKEPNLTKQVAVSPDGRISFPLVGEILAAGATIEEIEYKVKEDIRRYIPDAVVTVMLVQANSFKVFVLGKVARPGAYTIGKRVNVLQALSYAGGLTQFAKDDRIIIVRNNEYERHFNYKKIKEGQSLEQNILLEKGDVIIVP